ncbi:hypothetical protein [Tenacibaculum ovolyticum]|uniref:hypothetical protein n=1 Tax=Tenacibaculum ovolyticum TaxID=104270 RepID=UPI0007ED9849|nr:hypothetical protein [Tenacibaculum ovolyticum]
MKYYKLISSSNIKEVGKIPQSEDCIIGDLRQEFIPWEGEIDFDFKLPEPNLEKKSKQTSYIDVVAIHPYRFLVIDDILLAFLKNYNIGNHQNWKINTWYNKKELIEKYNLFLLSDTKQDKYIDFSRSEFYSKKMTDWDNSNVQKPIFVKDYKEYVFQKESLGDEYVLLHKNVTLDLSKTNEDMFRFFNAPLGGYFVSEKLKNDIEKNDFTGMEFTEVSELDKIEVIY